MFKSDRLRPETLGESSKRTTAQIIVGYNLRRKFLDLKRLLPERLRLRAPVSTALCESERLGFGCLIRLVRPEGLGMLQVS